MAEPLLTADYAQPDDPFAIRMLYMQKTAAELTALTTARQIGIGTLYFDTTNSGWRIGNTNQSFSNFITTGGNPNAVAITGGTINGTSIGVTTPAAGSFTTISSNNLFIATSAARVVNTTAALAAVTIGVAQSTYLATPAAAITVTIGAPNNDGERRRIIFGAATTVTWVASAPATAVVGLKTVFAAGEAIEIMYNQVAGSPANSNATSWYPF